jgi:hypothetical protein
MGPCNVETGLNNVTTRSSQKIEIVGVTGCTHAKPPPQAEQDRVYALFFGKDAQEGRKSVKKRPKQRAETNKDTDSAHTTEFDMVKQPYVRPTFGGPWNKSYHDCFPSIRRNPRPLHAKEGGQTLTQTRWDSTHINPPRMNAKLSFSKLFTQVYEESNKPC